MKNSSYTIGNRTLDLSTCSAVPQPTAPLRVQVTICRFANNLRVLPRFYLCVPYVSHNHQILSSCARMSVESDAHFLLSEVIIELGRGVGYVKTQLSCILHCYADDDMFRPLWAICRSQKFI